MEVNCGRCGHQMKMISHVVKIGSNGRCYIESYYECVIEGCMKSAVNIHETLHGVDDDSEIRIMKL